MTTSKTPLRQLTLQAETIAMTLKTAERGELPSHERYAKLITARKERTNVKFAIAMDDKTISLDMPWSQIEEASEASLTAYILKLMKDERNNS